MSEVVPLLRVANELAGQDICERLRTAGITCTVAQVPDVNWRASRLGRAAARMVSAILVHESDLDRARAVIEEFETEAATHRVSVCESRPVGEDVGDIGTGYEAVCVCDWTGPLRDTPDEARRDAYGHSKNVATEIVEADGD